MSNLKIEDWVKQSPSGFREAVHIILTAFSKEEWLAEVSYMKGGILMALAHGSSRYTSDIDFSTQLPRNPDKVLELITKGLAIANSELNYATYCRLQSHKTNPRDLNSNFPTLTMKVGHAKRGTKDFDRLITGKCTQLIPVDYSFSEDVPCSTSFEIGSSIIKAYSIELIIAEKYRALLQQPLRNRNRRQDVYDIHFLIKHQCFSEASIKLITNLIFTKSRSRGIHAQSTSMANPEIRSRSYLDYNTLKDEVSDLPDFNDIFPVVLSFYENLLWKDL